MTIILTAVSLAASLGWAAYGDADMAVRQLQTMAVHQHGSGDPNETLEESLHRFKESRGKISDADMAALDEAIFDLHDRIGMNTASIQTMRRRASAELRLVELEAKSRGVSIGEIGDEQLDQWGRQLYAGEADQGLRQFLGELSRKPAVVFDEPAALLHYVGALLSDAQQLQSEVEDIQAKLSEVENARSVALQDQDVCRNFPITLSGLQSRVQGLQEGQGAYQSHNVRTWESALRETQAERTAALRELWGILGRDQSDRTYFTDKEIAEIEREGKDIFYGFDQGPNTRLFHERLSLEEYRAARLLIRQVGWRTVRTADIQDIIDAIKENIGRAKTMLPSCG